MSVAVRLGRKPAVLDARVPMMANLAAVAALPPPPAFADWYAGVEETSQWGMLANDQLGDCVEAAIAHLIQTLTNYADKPAVPTDAEVIAAYEQMGGYNPADPSTDEGTVMLGPGGAMEQWLKAGVVFGGKRSRVKGYMSLHVGQKMQPVHVRQAIHYFGGVLLGISLPENVVASDAIPFIWDNASGPVAGGHEIVAVGYQTAADGEVVYDCVTWGQRVRLTEAFLRAVTDEAVAVYDEDFIDAAALDPDGFDATEMLAAMAAIHATG